MAATKIEVIITAATTEFEKRLRAAVSSVKGLDTAAQQAGRGGLSAARRGVESISKQLDVLQKAAIAVFSANTIRVYSAGLIGLADTYTRLDSRIGLVTSSAAEAAEVHARLYDVANRSRSTFESTAEVYARFAQATKNTGISQNELIGITETLNKAFIISGASSQESHAALIQLSQAFSSGVLRGEEFNSIMEQGGRVIDLLTSYLKVDRGELRAMAEDGKLTGDVLRNAIAAGAEAVNDEFGRMTVTVEQATNHLNNAFAEVVSGANKGTGATNEIAASIEKVATAVDVNRPTIIALFSSIITAAGQAGQAVLNVANSVRGFAAVAAGALSIKDFAGMSAADFAEWDKNFGTAAGDVKIKIKQVSEELKSLREGPGSVEKAAELRGLQDQLSALEAPTKKAAAESEKLAAAQTDVVQKTKLTAKELKELNKDLLPGIEAQSKYQQQLKAIAMAEQAGQFADNKAENEKIANEARKRASLELQKAKEAAEKFGQSSSAAAARKAEAEAKRRERELLKEEKLQSKIDIEKLRAQSESNILKLEEQKLAADNSGSELERAEKLLEVNRQIAAERIKLQEAEAQQIKGDKNKSEAEVIKAESEITRAKLAALQQEHNDLADVAGKRLTEIEEAWRSGTASVEQYTAALVAARKAGILTDEELNEKKIGAGDDMGAAFGLGITKARKAMQSDAEMMIYIGENIGSQIADGLASAWDGFINGTESAGEALSNFARSTISWLSQIILKQMLMNALFGEVGAGGQRAGGLFSMLGFATGGVVQALASGGSVGGWSPSRTADNIPIWATAGEFMQPVRAVDYYGLAFMERIRQLQFPRHIAHALAGGTIPSIPSGYLLAQGGMPAAAPETTVKTGDTYLKIVNVNDRNMVGDYLRTADGETAIINIIRRTGSTINTILGR